LKARAFKYVRADSLENAFAAYASAEGDCAYLAGGQSLVPSLSLRLQDPGVVIDISRLKELTGISRLGDVLRVGALTRHVELLTSPHIARHAPLLKKAAPFVAHPAIRNKGTFGGTIALADPSAEFPAMTLARRRDRIHADPRRLGRRRLWTNNQSDAGGRAGPRRRHPGARRRVL